MSCLSQEPRLMESCSSGYLQLGGAPFSGARAKKRLSNLVLHDQFYAPNSRIGYVYIHMEIHTKRETQRPNITCVWMCTYICKYPVYTNIDRFPMPVNIYIYIHTHIVHVVCIPCTNLIDQHEMTPVSSPVTTCPTYKGTGFVPKIYRHIPKT